MKKKRYISFGLIIALIFLMLTFYHSCKAWEDVDKYRSLYKDFSSRSPAPIKIYSEDVAKEKHTNYANRLGVMFGRVIVEEVVVPTSTPDVPYQSIFRVFGFILG